MSAPETSVLIPTYDQPALLLEALESVFAQTYRDREVIVVDDGSPPSTAEALRPLEDRIRIIRKEHGGIGAAKNAGLAACSGRYVAFLDHDDLWAPEKLEVQIGAMKAHPGSPVSYSSYAITGTPKRPGGVRPKDGCSGRILHRLLEETLIRTSSCLVVEREVLLDAGPFREDLKVADDYEMILRLAMRHPFLHVEDVLVTHRQHGGAASADTLAKDRDMVRILREWIDHRAARRRLGRHIARIARHQARSGEIRAALGSVVEGIRLRPTRTIGFLRDLVIS